VLIVWLYVGRNIVARLSALSDRTFSLARGDLKSPLPEGGGDEIGRMAEALAVFRATAVDAPSTPMRTSSGSAADGAKFTSKAFAFSARRPPALAIAFSSAARRAVPPSRMTALAPSAVYFPSNKYFGIAVSPLG
jgi:methyl-accepting chemotaxis protein